MASSCFPNFRDEKKTHFKLPPASFSHPSLHPIQAGSKSNFPTTPMSGDNREISERTVVRSHFSVAMLVLRSVHVAIAGRGMIEICV